jgi:hypothetical protein
MSVGGFTLLEVGKDLASQGVSMFKFNARKFRLAVLVALTISSMGMTTVPASAIDLGAKGKYIISVTPSARAAIEAAIAKMVGKDSE